MDYVIAFALGALFGSALALVAGYFRARTAKQAMLAQVREAFAGLSTEALSANNQQFLALAREALQTQSVAQTAELDSRKQLIDQSLTQIAQRLEQLRAVLGQVESGRKQDYGQLAQRLEEAARRTAELRESTDHLRAALAHPQRRGQWGERMAEDILQMAGMIEGVNYTKQQTLEGGKRPDFTFLLPGGVALNMDVKFPLDNYLRFIEADAADARDAAGRAFAGDVRSQVRAIATKDYIDPAAGTADFVLMFIPNERMFAEIQQVDGDLLADAARRRVVLVGPLSLLAVLAIVRQAAGAANLARQADEAIALIEQFGKQWIRFKEQVDLVGKRLDATVKEFQTLQSTRTNMLERPMDRLSQLRLGDGEAGNGESESDQ